MRASVITWTIGSPGSKRAIAVDDGGAQQAEAGDRLGFDGGDLA